MFLLIEFLLKIHCECWILTQLLCMKLLVWSVDEDDGDCIVKRHDDVLESDGAVIRDNWHL